MRFIFIISLSFRDYHVVNFCVRYFPFIFVTYLSFVRVCYFQLFFLTYLLSIFVSHLSFIFVLFSIHIFLTYVSLIFVSLTFHVFCVIYLSLFFVTYSSFTFICTKEVDCTFHSFISLI